MDYSLWSSAIFDKNVTEIKNPILGHHLKALFMLTTMAQSPASYLIHILIPSAMFSSKFWFIVDQCLDMCSFGHLDILTLLLPQQKFAPEAPVSEEAEDLRQRLALLQQKRAEDKARIKELEKNRAQLQQVCWVH